VNDGAEVGLGLGEPLELGNFRSFFVLSVVLEFGLCVGLCVGWCVGWGDLIAFAPVVGLGVLIAFAPV
jgi:hypothetical protein